MNPCSNPTPKSEFVVITSAAKMPNNCWGRYGRVAVLEVEPGYQPSRIDERPRAVKRIVELFDRQFWGNTDRCALRQAQIHCEELAARLNAEAAQVCN